MRKFLAFFGKNELLLAFVLIFLQISFLAKIQFTAWPEMTLWPYLILKGWLPYKDIAIVHTPLLLFLTSSFDEIFGIGIWQLKIFTWALIIFTDLMLFGVVKKLLDIKRALISLFIFVILQIYYEGNGLWFDLAITPLSIGVFYFINQKKYITAGFIWAIAVLTKQTAIWFCVPIIASVLSESKSSLKKIFSYISRFILGLFLVTLFFSLILISLGIMTEFIFWAIKFGVFYLPRAPGQISLPTLRQFVVTALPFLGIPITFLLNRKNLSHNLVFWALFGALGVYPRWELFHFQPALPFLSIILATLVTSINRQSRLKFSIVIIFFTLISIPIARNYIRNLGKEDRFYESDVQKTAEIVKNYSSQNDKIYVVNYWDNIYALTDTLPGVRPWIPYLPWYINYPGIKDSIMLQIRKTPPKLIVIGLADNTELGSFKIFELSDFIEKNYSQENIIDGKVSIFTMNK